MNDAQSHIRALASFAKIIAKSDFVDADEIWQLQLDLLEAQQGIQVSIAAEKTLPRAKQDRERLEELRRIRWHARSMGDALVWVLLGGDKQLIGALSHNSPVPIAEDGYGTRGAQHIAAGLSSQGWGFPVLHDISNLLRIGDVTFVRVDGRVPRSITVEVKTQLLDVSEPDDSGKRTYQVKTKVLTPVPLDDSGNLPPDVVYEPAELPRDDMPRGRVGRQKERMRRAAILGSSPDGVVSGLTEPFIHMSVDTSSTDNWPHLRRIIRRAHAEGFAGEVVDDAFYYGAFYSKGGVTADDIAAAPLEESLKDSAFKRTDATADRPVLVWTLPTEPSRAPTVSLPYVLYPVTQRAVLELLRYELLLLVMVDQTVVCDALRARGLEVEVRPQAGGPGEIVVVDRWVNDDGDHVKAELHAVRHIMQETIDEFRGLDYLADMVAGMVAGMRTHAPAEWDEDEAGQS
ncbi:hypothetical protein [Nocardioides sp. Soil805]|uniref:hypothetical protein n=1 Tax=Nocardioides sp. Soil805 TaxID=1736416 RepID=UPI000AD72320|nr:hypothetical protein [Nocardioides sp. Soil805]